MRVRPPALPPSQVKRKLAAGKAIPTLLQRIVPAQRRAIVKQIGIVTAALPESEHADVNPQTDSGGLAASAEYEFPVDFGSVAEATAAAASMGFSRFAPKMVEVQMPAGSAASMKQCSGCSAVKPASQYSSTQLAKKSSVRKCITCARGGAAVAGVGERGGATEELLRNSVDAAAKSVGRGGSKEKQKEIDVVYNEVEELCQEHPEMREELMQFLEQQSMSLPPMMSGMADPGNEQGGKGPGGKGAGKGPGSGRGGHAGLSQHEQEALAQAMADQLLAEEEASVEAKAAKKKKKKEKKKKKRTQSETAADDAVAAMFAAGPPQLTTTTTTTAGSAPSTTVDIKLAAPTVNIKPKVSTAARPPPGNWSKTAASTVSAPPGFAVKGIGGSTTAGAGAGAGGGGGGVGSKMSYSKSTMSAAPAVPAPTVSATKRPYSYTRDELLALRNSPLSKSVPKGIGTSALRSMAQSSPSHAYNNARMAPGTARYAAREAMVAATRPLPPTERAAGSSVPPLSPFKLLERAVVEIARQAKDAGQHTVSGELAVLTVLTQALRRGEPVDITVGR